MALVTVLMAVRDGAPFVGEALESVLSQDRVDFDVVVVDDASADGTAEILNDIDDPRVRVLRTPSHLGLTASLRRGLAMATGKYIARIDADDVCLPGRLHHQLALIERQSADICFGRAVDAAGAVWWRERSWPLILWRGLFENAYGPHPSVLFRHEAIEAAGGYDEGFPRAQDYDLWDRCVAAGLRFAYLPQAVIRYRVHDGAVTRAHQPEQEAFAKTVSDRALLLAFPDMGLEERKGLRWVMTGRGGQPTSEAIGSSLAYLDHRIHTFAKRTGGLMTIWSDVSGRLSRRLSDLAPSHRGMAGVLMRRAAFKSWSPRAFVRAWRTSALG